MVLHEVSCFSADCGRKHVLCKCEYWVENCINFSTVLVSGRKDIVEKVCISYIDMGGFIRHYTHALSE